MCPEWHPRMKASWRQGQIFWLITSNATRASKHRTLGRGCMWHYYVAVNGQRQALHMVPKLKCGGGGRGGDICTAPIFHRGTKNNQSARSPYSSSSPPKKHKPIPPTYTCIFTAVLFVVLCDLGRKGLQLLKRHNMTTPLSFFSNLNDLKVFLQFYWTQVWSYCVALSLTGAEESDVVIVW